MAKLPRRKCANKECRQWFHPIREGQIVCSYQCASAVGKEQTRKAHEAAQRKAQSSVPAPSAKNKPEKLTKPRNVRRNHFSAPLRKKNAPPGASGKPRLSR
ncbi:hypothetical protein ABT70_11855 [Salmonella enterica subsp. enterica serovar Typhimurium]|nr:hypothetical protein ABT70_11855 [Salmonella enterica subsp. enterica serovar Typhimurium]